MSAKIQQEPMVEPLATESLVLLVVTLGWAPWLLLVVGAPWKLVVRGMEGHTTGTWVWWLGSMVIVGTMPSGGSRMGSV